MSDTLIVIPVRGGSVGLPRKALRPLAGVSPLVRTIRTAQQIGRAQVLVTTDDDEVATVAKAHGALTTHELPLDGTHTIDQSVYQAVALYGHGGLVVTMQCTSPLLGADTVREVIARAPAETVRDDRHPRVGQPLVVRQAMAPCWRITGGCVATPREYLTPTGRRAPQMQLVEVTGAEAIDLDTPEDWALAEWYLGYSAREQVLARVLTDQWHPIGATVVVCSADREPLGESEQRRQWAQQYTTGLRFHARGANTYEELQSAARFCRGVSDVVLVTSAYHQLRAFLTLAHALCGTTTRIWNAPVPSGMERLPDELAKIAAYQAKGHVASYEDGLAHLVGRGTTTNAFVVSSPCVT